MNNKYNELLKQNGFLIAIIYNWKGLKEENYLYTPKQLRKAEPELYNDCVTNGHGEGGFSADKTYMTNVIKTEEELTAFFNGDYNEDIEECKTNNPDINYDDWYWEFRTDNLFVA
jgi:hypothetical protein